MPVEKTLTFQQISTNPRIPRPWPVTIVDSDQVHEVIFGEPDATTLIGFQTSEEQIVNIIAAGLTLEQLAQQIIGTYPVYSARHRSGIYATTLPIDAAHVAEIETNRLRNENATLLELRD